jgi:hypothetical protein
LSSSVVTIVKLLGKTLSYAVTETATVALHNILSKVFFVTSTTTVSIVHLLNKLLSVVSTNTTTLQKSIYTVLSVISNSIVSLLVALFPKLGAVVRYTFIINTKDRLIKLFKIRSLLANKRQGTIKK